MQLETYMCVDKKSERVEVKKESNAEAAWCYRKGLREEVMRNGFWYEVCQEIADTYEGCSKNREELACMSQGF